MLLSVAGHPTKATIANSQPIESHATSREKDWPRGSPCARHWALVRGKPGAELTLEVSFHRGRKTLAHREAQACRLSSSIEAIGIDVATRARFGCWYYVCQLRFSKISRASLCDAVVFSVLAS